MLAEVGGLEIAALAGFIVGAAPRGCRCCIDGVIAAAALLVGARLCRPCWGTSSPATARPSRAPSARSTTSASSPWSTSGLRLGEGRGACLAVPSCEAAARVLGEMATFDWAGVKDAG